MALDYLNPYKIDMPIVNPKFPISGTGRLAYQQYIADEILNFYDRNTMLEKIRASGMYEMNFHILELSLSKKNPMTIRSTESLERSYKGFEHGLVYRLVVDLRDVEMMQYTMVDLPPFEFITKPSGLIEYQCLYCGQVNEIAKHLECRKCGAPRKVMR